MLPLKCIAFFVFFCFLIDLPPRHWCHRITDARFLRKWEAFSLQFCPKIHLVCDRKFSTTSFQIQAQNWPTTARESFQHTFYNCPWIIYHIILHFLLHPDRVQNRRRRRLWQWNIEKLECAISLSTSTSNFFFGNSSSLCQRFLSAHWPAFLFPWKAVPLFSKSDSLHILNSCHSLFRDDPLLEEWVVFMNILQIAKNSFPNLS